MATDLVRRVVESAGRPVDERITIATDAIKEARRARDEYQIVECERLLCAFLAQRGLWQDVVTLSLRRSGESSSAVDFLYLARGLEELDQLRECLKAYAAVARCGDASAEMVEFAATAIRRIQAKTDGE